MGKQRREMRETKVADAYLNELLNLFIKFKNEHYVEEEGVLIFDDEVTARKNELKAQWIFYCDIKTGKSVRLTYNRKAFHVCAENHILQHRKLAYLNQVMRLINKKYSAEMLEYDQILDCFEKGINCADAAFELVNHTFVDQENEEIEVEEEVN